MGYGWFPVRRDGRLAKTRTDAPPGSKGTVARGQSARGATGQQPTIGAEELLGNRITKQSQFLVTAIETTTCTMLWKDRQLSEIIWPIRNACRCPLLRPHLFGLTGSESEPRTRGSVKKPGTVPSAAHGRGVLSMTYGRRGDCTQGFFTDPRVSARVVTDTSPVAGLSRLCSLLSQETICAPFPSRARQQAVH